jgi:hypothetical protein
MVHKRFLLMALLALAALMPVAITAAEPRASAMTTVEASPPAPPQFTFTPAVTRAVRALSSVPSWCGVK